METLEKYAIAPALILLTWLGSFEWRLRSKVCHKTCDATANPIQKSQERIESHLWDIMRAQNIKPTIDVPNIIKEINKNEE